MILQHVLTKEKITVSRYLYEKQFRGAPDEWKNVTPKRTQKQVAQAHKFVRLGMLTRTKSNLEQVIRTFGPYHGIFNDAVNGLELLINIEKHHD